MPCMCRDHGQLFVCLFVSYSFIIREASEALPILCVSLLPVRERERYREREIDGSDGTFGERESRLQREREIDGSDVDHCRAKNGDEFTSFPCTKIWTIGDELTLSRLPKIRTFRFSLHTSRLSLHGEVTMVALSSHFPWPLPKFFALFVPPLSNGTSNATSDRKPKTNDQILAQSNFVLPIENNESN